jgi:hypothetical protein
MWRSSSTLADRAENGARHPLVDVRALTDDLMDDFSHVPPELLVDLHCLVVVLKRLAKRHLVLGVKDGGRELSLLHLPPPLLLVPQL